MHEIAPEAESRREVLANHILVQAVFIGTLSVEKLSLEAILTPLQQGKEEKM